MNVRRAFNNVRYKDRPRQEGDGDVTVWSEDVPPTAQRFQEKPINIDGNYLYTDEDVDRFNSGKDFTQEHGQPKGVDSSSKAPVTQFESDKSSDDIKKVFDDGDLISSFNNGEKIVHDILKDSGGQ